MPARVVQWSNHFSAMCIRARRAQWPRSGVNPSRGPVRRIRLRKSNYLKKISPMHMMIREIILGRQQSVWWCPL